MASDTKPTIIIVSGGWHVPKTYEKLTTALRQNGYEVHVPRLPTVNQARPPNADLYSDTEFIRNYVESLIEAGRTVVAILHSYGGHVGTNALYGLGLETRTAKGLKGGVSHLVYLAGYAVLEGAEMMDTVKKFNHMELVPDAFPAEKDGTCLIGNPKAMVGPGCSDEETDAYINTLVRFNGTAMYQPITHCAWREIPVSYVHTTADFTVPIPYQRSFIEGLEQAGVKVRTTEIETGHCPNFTATKEVVDFINQVIDG